MGIKDIIESLKNVEYLENSQRSVSAYTSREVMDYLLQDNKPGCEFKHGDIVEKATYEVGDHNPLGEKGVIVGSICDPELGEAYLVNFLGSDAPSFVLKFKIKKLSL